VGDDVTKAVLAILNGQQIPAELNCTNVALSPKKRNPALLGTFAYKFM